MPRVVIVGGGISGLSTAWYLAKAGIRATIIERQDRLGGVIRTDYIDGCVAEAGPDSFITVKPAGKELAEELGLGGDLIGSNDHQRATFIWRGGRLVKLPDGTAISMRSTLVFHRENGEWKLVQQHNSVGIPNEEVVGKALPV